MVSVHLRKPLFHIANADTCCFRICKSGRTVVFTRFSLPSATQCSAWLSPAHINPLHRPSMNSPPAIEALTPPERPPAAIRVVVRLEIGQYIEQVRICCFFTLSAAFAKLFHFIQKLIRLNFSVIATVLLYSIGQQNFRMHKTTIGHIPTTLDNRIRCISI